MSITPNFTTPRFVALRFLSLTVILTTFCVVLSSCSTNPATGQRQFTALMPASSEAQIGAEEHSKIIENYGVVQDTKLQSMVDTIGQRIVPVTERKDVTYTFTILDTPDVNAFALPGGFVYVTRGLLALANSEDELAAVIGHEIGHVTARHSAARYSRSVATGLGATLVSVLLDSQEAGELLGLGANLYLSSYSREQEHEADDLGIRYISKTGYDSLAMSSFLTTLERHHEFEQLLLGQTDQPQNNYFSTHPVTRDRISRTRVTAANTAAGNSAGRIVNPYLSTINGMIYGDSSDQGFVYKNRFVHPELGFAFNVPKGYIVKNTATNVVVMSPKSGALAIMDGAKIAANQPQGLLGYTRNVWLKDKNLKNVQQRNINGKSAVLAEYTQVIKGQAGKVFIAVIKWDNSQIFRFQIAVPQQLAVAEQESLLALATSFTTLSTAERAQVKPKRLVTVKSSNKASIPSISAKMPFDDGLNEMRFRIINGLSSSDQIATGDIYKTIVQ